MAMIKAIVRGPESYFDGQQLQPPGALVEVDEKFVSEEDFYEDEVMVRLAQPVVQDGKLIREAKETVKKRVKFRPANSGPRTEPVLTTPEVATAQPDRLDVTAFLQKSADDIASAITTGSVDAHLGVIEQAEIAKKGPARKGVTEALAARRAALSN